MSIFLADRFGFTTNGGPRVNAELGVYVGTVAQHFDEYDKRDHALRLAAERGVPLARCSAIGDSRSDIPLFEALPASLAINAGAEAREAATAVIDTNDLTDIIPWLRQWVRAFT